MGNTANKLNKCGILTGQLECFCLACDVKLNYDQVGAHCLLDEHEANFEKTMLVQEYTSDGIRKVPKGYFCETCNLFIRILEQVKIHVSSPLHATSKTASREDYYPKTDFKVTPEGVIAWGWLNINTQQWNGIINNTCIVCDVDVEDIPTHIEESTHAINLIQARVMRKSNCLYRKLGSSVQCLLRNILIPKEETLAHINSQHKTVSKTVCDGRIIKKAPQNYNVNNKLQIKDFITKVNENAPGGLCVLCDWSVNDSEFTSHPNHYHHQTLLALHNKWIEDKNNESKFVVLPNKTDSTAGGDTNKGVDDSISNKEFDFKVKENGSQESVDVKNIQGTSLSEQSTAHDVKGNVDTKVNIKTENVDGKLINHEKVTTQGAADSSKDAIGEIKELAIEFALKFKSKDSTQCTLCEEIIKGSIDTIKAHINSAKHKKNFFKETNLNSTSYETTKMSEVLKFSCIFNNVVKTEMILNNEICVNIFSYHVFVHEDEGVKCYICNELIDPQQHFENEMHKKLWGKSLMITSFENEFVREVNTGVYHCGFCNIIYTSWNPLLTHLMSRSHKTSKMAAEKSLVMHLKDIMQSMARLH